MAASVLRSTAYALLATAASYISFIGLLTIPFFQNEIIYLHSLTMTWFQDVNFPEQWGFLHNQVTPFTLSTPDGETLHAWHILPLGLYQEHESQLLQEPAGLAKDITERLSFKLLREDPDALLVLYLHGAAGTLASGWRPPSYRAMSALAPHRIHTLAIDYRGFGASTGTPSEEGLQTDALALARFALDVAEIPPRRIVLFGQSLGTAVALELAHRLATVGEGEPVLFTGMVLVAPFVDVAMLTATYRVGGMVPLLDPVAHFPRLLAWLNGFVVAKWPSGKWLSELVRACEGMAIGGGGGGYKYHVTIIHAQDDYDIPWTHSESVFWHAVNASLPEGIGMEDLEKEEAVTRTETGEGGLVCGEADRKGVPSGGYYQVRPAR